MTDPDVICLQEVSRFLELDERSESDQADQLLQLFPGGEIVFGPAIEVSYGSGKLCQLTMPH